MTPEKSERRHGRTHQRNAARQNKQTTSRSKAPQKKEPQKLGLHTQEGRNLEGVKKITHQKNSGNVENPVPHSTKTLRAIRLSVEVCQHVLRGQVLHHSKSLSNKIPNKMVSSMDVSRLPSDMRSNSKVNSTHIILIYDSGSSLGETNIFEKVPKLQQLPSCLRERNIFGFHRPNRDTLSQSVCQPLHKRAPTRDQCERSIQSDYGHHNALHKRHPHRHTKQGHQSYSNAGQG